MISSKLESHSSGWKNWKLESSSLGGCIWSGKEAKLIKTHQKKVKLGLAEMMMRAMERAQRERREKFPLFHSLNPNCSSFYDFRLSKFKFGNNHCHVH